MKSSERLRSRTPHSVVDGMGGGGTGGGTARRLAAHCCSYDGTPEPPCSAVSGEESTELRVERAALLPDSGQAAAAARHSSCAVQPFAAPGERTRPVAQVQLSSSPGSLLAGEQSRCVTRCRAAITIGAWKHGTS